MKKKKLKNILNQILNRKINEYDQIDILLEKAIKNKKKVRELQKNLIETNAQIHLLRHIQVNELKLRKEK